MNTKGVVTGIAFFSMAFTAVWAADSNVRSNAVTELRGQDNAFALMMESYRQIQILMIEADYDKLVTLAKRVTDPKQRDQLLLMAQQQREARIAKVHDTMKGFDSAYSTSRKEQEKKTDGAVITKMTPEEADDQIQHLRPFVPKVFRQESSPGTLVPAGARAVYGEQRP